MHEFLTEHPVKCALTLDVLTKLKLYRLCVFFGYHLQNGIHLKFEDGFLDVMYGQV